MSVNVNNIPSTNGEKRILKSPGGDCSDLFGAEFLGSPCHQRVLKPPGGGTSVIFGGSEPAPEKPSGIVRKKSAQASSIVLDDNVSANAKPVENGNSKQDAAPVKPSQPISNGHAAPAAAGAASRGARVPPGGFSSGLW